MVLSTGSPNDTLKGILAVGVAAFGLSAALLLLGHARGRRRIAKVIDRLNEFYGHFDRNGVIPGSAIYPEVWRGFGDRTLLQIVGAHIATISIVTVVATISIFAK